MTEKDINTEVPAEGASFDEDLVVPQKAPEFNPALFAILNDPSYDDEESYDDFAATGSPVLDITSQEWAAYDVPDPIKEFFVEHPKVVLAFSGGVDSSLLLAFAFACGAHVYPVTITSQFQYPFEVRDAQMMSYQIGVGTTIVKMDVLENEHLQNNPPDRCYWCKRAIICELQAYAQQHGIETIIDGTNATDNPDNRPGFKALEEAGVLSPLRMAGMTKDQVRDFALHWGLDNAQKPSYSCRATQLPYETVLTQEVLDSVPSNDWYAE